MTIGIRNIGSYIPEGRIANHARLAEFEIDAAFLEGKLGVHNRAVKSADETTTDLCIKAAQDLVARGGPVPEDVECVVVVTQNPGAQIPHVSARVHGAMGLKTSCACFDISLGCSGYVYGLAAVQAFMREYGLRNGLLFTADPYSQIINSADKNTALLFGDAATCTWIGESPVFATGRFTFGTIGAEHAELTCPAGGQLFMNGRAIFNFAAKNVPADIRRLLELNETEIGDVDRFIFHQGSKFIVDTLTKLLQLDPARVALAIQDCGNTVSSSIPLILAQELTKPEIRRIVLCGFGAGLSWSSALLTRTAIL